MMHLKNAQVALCFLAMAHLPALEMFAQQCDSDVVLIAKPEIEASAKFVTETAVTEADAAVGPLTDSEKQAAALRMTELSEQVDKIKADLNKAERKLLTFRQEQSALKPLSGLEQVKTTVLPDNPTREQCVAYLTQLRDAVTKRKRYSTEHLVVEKLRAIPGKHIDLLVDEYSEGTRLGRYVRYAFLREYSQENLGAIRKRFTQTLDKYPKNIDVILAHGWCKDVEATIREIIASGKLPENQSTAVQWIQAAVELQDPKIYPQLHKVTVASDYWQDYLGYLRALPDFDLAYTFNACFAKEDTKTLSATPYTGIVERIGRLDVQTVLMAAEAGNIKALDALIATIPESESSPLVFTINPARYRFRALSFIEFRGSNQEIKAWYKENRDKLVFDNLYKRFIIPEDF